MNKFKVDTFVLDKQFGWGKVLAVNKLIINKKINYIINIKFAKLVLLYTKEVKYINGDKHPTLFTREEAKKNFDLSIPIIVPDLAVDTKLIVWNKSGKKFNAHFSHFDQQGYICCFLNGKTSWSKLSTQTQKWDHYLLLEL